MSQSLVKLLCVAGSVRVSTGRSYLGIDENIGATTTQKYPQRKIRNDVVTYGFIAHEIGESASQAAC